MAESSKGGSQKADIKTIIFVLLQWRNYDCDIIIMAHEKMAPLKTVFLQILTDFI